MPCLAFESGTDLDSPLISTFPPVLKTRYALNAMSLLYPFYVLVYLIFWNGARGAVPQTLLFLVGGQLGNEAQRNRKAFELVMRLEIKLRIIVARIFRIFLDDNLSCGQREFRFGLVRRPRISGNIITDPFIEPGFEALFGGEAADFVADHALQIVSESAGGEEIRQPGREICIGSGIRIVVGLRLLQGLSADKNGVIRIFPVRKRHESAISQLLFATVSNADFRRTLHVHTAIIGREGMDRETFDHATGLSATNAGAPAIELEGT